MYDRLLHTFIVVADCGSFTKAAQCLYVSSTAIMKQMNALEHRLELTLLARTPTGVCLTQEGEMIYHDAKFIIDYSQKSIANARAMQHSSDTTFCVGTSLLNPAKPFMDLWYGINKYFSNYKLHLVPFGDDSDSILSEIDQLGQKFDFLVGVCDSKQWLTRCGFLPLGRYRKMVAVSREHPLAKRQLVSIEDLYGETLMMVESGDSGINDFLRNDLTKHHPEIHIENTPKFYDMSVFNRCAETHNVLLTIECWSAVHPSLVTIPVEWDYEIPYGLLYSSDAPADVMRFIDAAATELRASKQTAYFKQLEV